MEFSRQEYRSGLPFPPPGDLLDPGIEPVSLVSPALAGFFTTAPPGKPALSRRQKHKNRYKLYYQGHGIICSRAHVCVLRC